MQIQTTIPTLVGHLGECSLPSLVAEAFSSDFRGFKILYYRADGGSIYRQAEDLYAKQLKLKAVLSVLETEAGFHIITQEKAIIGLVPIAELAPELTRLLGAHSQTGEFVKTAHKITAIPVGDVPQHIQQLAKYGLFEPYVAGDSREFGFVACRQPTGMLITGRGSNKTTCSSKDLAMVTAFNGLNQVSHSEALKPSRNSHLAWKLLETHPGINWVIHTHMPMAGAPYFAYSVPGTESDWATVKTQLHPSYRAFNQHHHGSVILLSDLDQLADTLLQHNLFKVPRENAYELSYQRFENNGLLNMVVAGVSKGSHILDAASGSGAFARKLRAAGYQVTAAEPNPIGALQQPPVLPVTLEQLSACGSEFDAVTIRQAINYLQPEQLKAFFIEAFKVVKPGGRLFFDTFLAEASIKPYRVQASSDASMELLTKEFNLVNDGQIQHSQVTQVYAKHKGISNLKLYDFNVFNLVKPEQFKQAFGPWQVTASIQEGNSLRYSLWKPLI